MRLVLSNEFTWDGVYDIVDEFGDAQYVVVAEIGDNTRSLRLFTKSAFDTAQRNADARADGTVGELAVGKNPLDTLRIRDVSNEFGVPEAEVIGKAGLGKAKYSLSLRTRVIGSMTRLFKNTDDPYDVEIKDWFVSGDVYTWEYIIVDKHGKVADAGVSGDKVGLEYSHKEDKLKCALMLMALAGLSRDMRDSFSKQAAGAKISEREPIVIPSLIKGDAEGSGLEEAIGMVRNGAEKVGGIFKKK